MNYWQNSFTLGWTYTNTAPNSTQNLLGEKQEIGRLKSHLQSSPNRDQLIEIALWSQICVSLTRCIFDRVTTDMRHINSFTHETLWVVTHTACIVTFVSLVTNYLPKQIFLIIFFFIARQCIRLKLRVARLIEEYICNKRNWKDILNSLQNYHLFRHKRPASDFKNSLDTLWQKHSFFNGLSQTGAVLLPRSQQVLL